MVKSREMHQHSTFVTRTRIRRTRKRTPSPSPSNLQNVHHHKKNEKMNKNRNNSKKTYNQCYILCNYNFLCKIPIGDNGKEQWLRPLLVMYYSFDQLTSVSSYTHYLGQTTKNTLLTNILMVTVT